MNKQTLSRLFWGSVLILFGLVWLLSYFFPGFDIHLEIFWPVFLVLPGIFLLILYISESDKNKVWGLVIPITILFMLAIHFLINMFVTIYLSYPLIWGLTSFYYTFSVGIALYIGWLSSSKRKKGLLVGSRVLGIISLIVFVINAAIFLPISLIAYTDFSKYWPVLLIALGLFILLMPILKKIFFPKGNYFGKTENEWEEWGEKLGDDIEKNVESAVEGIKPKKQKS